MMGSGCSLLPSNFTNLRLPITISYFVSGLLLDFGGTPTVAVASGCCHLHRRLHRRQKPHVTRVAMRNTCKNRIPLNGELQ